MNLTRIYKSDFSKDVNELVSAASDIKTELFRSSYQLRRVDSSKVQKYLGAVNGILARYSKIFEETVNEMKNASPEEGASTIPYDVVKPYLYTDYDYASILKYTDGLYKGIADNKIKDQEDMDDFFTHTVGIAFKGLPDSTAMILDELISMDDTREASKVDASKFNAVKAQNIFDKSDRAEVYKAIEKTVDFIVNEIDVGGKIDIATDDITVRIAFIVSVFDYATYSVAAYMARVYAINMYSYGFIYNSNKEIQEPAAVTEATEIPEVKEKISSEAYKVMIPADDANYRDPKNFVQLIKLLQEFASVLGTTICDKFDELRIDEKWFTYKIDDSSDNNIFKNELLGNALYEFIVNRMKYWNWEDNWKQRQEFADEFYGYIHNAQQGISTTITSKQEMLPIIRDTWADKKSTDDFRKIAGDLGEWALEVLSCLRKYFNDGIEWRSMESNEPRGNNSVLNATAESIKASKELYNDIVEVVLSRLRGIELMINKDKEDELARIFADVSVKVPGGEKDDISHNNNMMDSSPDTSRLPVDLYALPTYESLRMYSEYAASLLSDDDYFSEAVDFSKIIDTLQALVAGWFKKVVQFFDNPKLKAASEWVSRNADKLNSVTYNGPLEVLPYKENINYPSIDKFNDILKANFNDTVIANEENLKKFLDSLYETNDATLAGIWKKGEKGAEQQVENYVLFGTNPGDTPKTVTLNDNNQIKNYMRTWISTVTAAPSLRTAMVNSERKASTIMKEVKGRLVSFKQKQQGNATSTSTASAPELSNASAGSETNTTNATASANGNATQNTNTTGNNDHRIQEALNGIQSAYQKVVFPAYMIFRRAITDQYNYIKNAYTNANK